MIADERLDVALTRPWFFITTASDQEIVDMAEELMAYRLLEQKFDTEQHRNGQFQPPEGFKI